MRLHWKLNRILKRRRLSVAQFARQTGIDRGTLANICNNTVGLIAPPHIARICEELGVGVSELMGLEPDDIWASILSSGQVTVHYGSRTHPSQPTKQGRPTLDSEYVGDWDLRASNAISHYLSHRQWEGHIDYSPHMSNNPHVGVRDLETLARQIVRQGNHIIIGSPLANVFTEFVMSAMYGVAPFDESEFPQFPYGFVWQPERWTRSSFGRPGEKEFGIQCNRSGQMVAYQDLVEVGDGPDCGLITVLRNSSLIHLATREERAERVVIVLTGHSGPGTLAAAQIATDDRLRPELYPPTEGSPFGRAVRVTYNRPAPSRFDNRVITRRELVPLPVNVKIA